MELKTHENQASWNTLRKVLSRQHRVTVSFKRKGKGVLHIRKSTQPETELKELYRQLQLPPVPGSVIKTVIDPT